MTQTMTKQTTEEMLAPEEKAALDEASAQDAWPTELTEDEKELLDKVVKSHKPCWGTGRVGFKTMPDKTLQPIVCRCVWKAWGQLLTKRKAASEAK